MNIEEYKNLIISSKVDDWLLKKLDHGNSGPSYLYELCPITQGKKLINIEVNHHSHIATYKKDISIFIAWGLTQEKDYKNFWLDELNPKIAMSKFIDFFYINSLIHRDIIIYIEVDDDKCYIPNPEEPVVIPKLSEIAGFIIPKIKYNFFKMFNDLNSYNKYPELFKKTKIEPADNREWFNV